MKEMTELETRQAAGGSVPVLITIGRTLLIAGTGAMISGWSDFKDGFQEAYAAQQNRAK